MNAISVSHIQCCNSAPFTAASTSSSNSTRAFSSLFLQRGRIGSVSRSRSIKQRTARESSVVCGLGDFIGGDLLGFDLDKWYKDVEDYGSIAVYPPHEGGAEGRYVTRLRREGYHIMHITARGLGDPEACLTKIHGVRPAHLGKQAISHYYLPPEVDYRLSALPEGSKGLVLYVIEAKVLSKTELQYLALLPALRNRVKVIAECGNWRKFRWKPLREAAGLPLTQVSEAVKEPRVTETSDLIEAVQIPKAVLTETDEKKPERAVL